MATSDSVLLKKVSGHIGRQIVIKNYSGKTVLSKFPNFDGRKFTPKQIIMQERMLGANYYAQGHIADPKLRDEAILRLNVTKNKLYTSLVKEYFKNESIK